MFKITCLCFLAAAAAYGDFGDVVTSYDAPANSPIALAHGPNVSDMWVFCCSPPYSIYRINSWTGNVHETIASPWQEYTRGLAYATGGYMYVSDYSTDNIFLVHRSNFASIISSFPAGHDMYGGIALKTTGDGGVGGNSLWAATVPPVDGIGRSVGVTGNAAPPWPWTVYHHNRTNGSIISSFLPLIAVEGLAWDWRNEILWGAGGPLVAYTEAGSLMGSYWFYRGHAKRYFIGLCYDGEYLWASCYSPNYEILQIHCPEGIGVEPSSMGKIKAVYR
jgi:hypothetical protein